MVGGVCYAPHKLDDGKSTECLETAYRRRWQTTPVLVLPLSRFNPPPAENRFALA